MTSIPSIPAATRSVPKSPRTAPATPLLTIERLDRPGPDEIVAWSWVTWSGAPGASLKTPQG